MGNAISSSTLDCITMFSALPGGGEVARRNREAREHDHQRKDKPGRAHSSRKSERRHCCIPSRTIFSSLNSARPSSPTIRLSRMT